MQFTTTITFGVIFISAGVIVMLLSLRWFNKDDVSVRLNEFVVDHTDVPRRWQPTALQSRELTGSLANRLLKPAIKWIGQVLGRLTPVGIMERLTQQLMIAGNPLGLGAREFYGITLIFTLLGIWLAFMLIRQGMTLPNLMLSALAVIICYLLPKIWLLQRVKRRQNIIRRGLPDALDMLSVCASAGLGFDQSLQRVSEHWDTPLGAELGRVISEMEMGISRRDALRNLAERCDVTELSSFVALILQSEQLGMSISDILHAQADQMRIERRFRAQEQAQKIPTKMLIPMAFLILPAILAVTLGPSVPAIIELFERF